MKKILKNFTEVKLRKIDDAVILELNEIMDHYKQLSASGGLTQYILNFSKTRDKISALEQQNMELKKTIQSLNSTIIEKDTKIQSIKNTYATLINLLKPD